MKNTIRTLAVVAVIAGFARSNISRYVHPPVCRLNVLLSSRRNRPNTVRSARTKSQCGKLKTTLKSPQAVLDAIQAAREVLAGCVGGVVRSARCRFS